MTKKLAFVFFILDPETKEILGGEKLQMPLEFSDVEIASAKAEVASDAKGIDRFKAGLSPVGVSKPMSEILEAAAIIARKKLEPLVQKYLAAAP